MPVDTTHPPLTRTARFAWAAVTLILAGVIALVVYAFTEPPVTVRIVQRPVTSADVLRTVSSVPHSTFDTVGITVPGTSLKPPDVLTGQPPLTSGGKPEVLAVGADYCPFCAAERWPLVVALSRFGQFHVLHDAQSSATSVFPSIQTFSFADTSYTSRYVTFVGTELYSSIAGHDGTFTQVAHLTPAQRALVARYGATSRAAGATRPAASLPFVDIGNRMVTTTSGFSPALLLQQSQVAIADSLADPASANPAARQGGTAIVAAANELTAGICAVTHQQPTAVCTSKGVRAADLALGLAP